MLFKERELDEIKPKNEYFGATQHSFYLNVQLPSKNQPTLQNKGHVELSMKHLRIFPLSPRSLLAKWFQTVTTNTQADRG